jgi:hypothetical protein
MHHFSLNEKSVTRHTTISCGLLAAVRSRLANTYIEHDAMGMKCSNSAFNAQGSRVIIVVVHVHVGALKIYM